MDRAKNYLKKPLRLRDHNAQIGETYAIAIIKALNKLTELVILKTKAIV
ncbi:hypothetical protein BTN50_1313 [Candidatus Enterovibrio altilux]|uniref:Mobile element protein n=1 Tax=Candidatus Enterovibrio altilux TaxID=1927128 RepID=A0A291B9X9_9GAMM|nr:hypothetical protein BTN50_1313 [Candidatus Enterovibrio luxaltus]